jgi:hypothetical protein
MNDSNSNTESNSTPPTQIDSPASQLSQSHDHNFVETPYNLNFSASHNDNVNNKLSPNSLAKLVRSPSTEEEDLFFSSSSIQISSSSSSAQAIENDKSVKPDISPNSISLFNENDDDDDNLFATTNNVKKPVDVKKTESKQAIASAVKNKPSLAKKINLFEDSDSEGENISVSSTSKSIESMDSFRNPLTNNNDDLLSIKSINSDKSIKSSTVMPSKSAPKLFEESDDDDDDLFKKMDKNISQKPKSLNVKNEPPTAQVTTNRRASKFDDLFNDDDEKIEGTGKQALNSKSIFTNDHMKPVSKPIQNDKSLFDDENDDDEEGN